MKKTLTIATLLAMIAFGVSSAFSAEKPRDSKPKAYPLQTCVVSGEKLGSMGKAYTFQHEGKEVQLCCKSCLKDFKKEPAKYMKKIEDASKK